MGWYVGRRCRTITIKDVAEELLLDWQTVKALDKQYMQIQLDRAGTPGPKAIGIDEISIRKGHTYRIVVSDLIRHRPLWFGGTDRSETSMAMFYDWLGERKAKRIRLAVMDRWKPFRHATTSHAPQAAINQLSRSAAVEYATDRIRVNAICPGGTETAIVAQLVRDHPEAVAAALALTPLGRLALPAEIADVALFLASDESSYVTGVALPIDGGYSVL